jgi:hypothetical protein
MDIHVFLSEPWRDLIFILPFLSKCGIRRSEHQRDFWWKHIALTQTVNKYAFYEEFWKQSYYYTY